MSTQIKFPSNTFNKIEVDTEVEEYTKYIEQKCKQYGIPLGIFSNSKEAYTEYEREALNFIQMKKEIPDELKHKLISTLDTRNKQRSEILNTEPLEMTESLAESILGIKIE